MFLYRRSQKVQAARLAAQSWPGAPGLVVHSSIQARRLGNNSRSDVPLVVYTYPVGAAVTVFINPANPAEAALER